MNRERIEETVRLWQAEPDKAKGKPMVIARAEGSKAVMEHGSFSWRTDMPVPLGGTNEAPSPTALLLSALAGCAVVFIRDTLAPQLGVTVDAIEATARCETDARGLLGMDSVAPDVLNVDLTIAIQSRKTRMRFVGLPSLAGALPRLFGAHQGAAGGDVARHQAVLSHWMRSVARRNPDPRPTSTDASSEPSVPEQMMTTVVVFGGAGFFGRRLVHRLTTEGMTVRVAVRHPDPARIELRSMGFDRVTIVSADVRDQASVAAAIAGADAVVNTVSAYVEKGGVTFEAVHVQGAQIVARETVAAGVPRLVLVSGIGADADSGSPYIRARGRGEQVVQQTFPEATIVRPGAMFGPGDALFGTLAELARLLPILPLIGSGSTRLQPVFVEDVAEAVANILTDPGTVGRIYELAGPGVYTLRDLVRMTLHLTRKRRLLLPVPFAVAEIQARLFEFLPNPPLTTGQVDLLKADNVASGTLPGLRELNIQPKTVEEVVPTYIGTGALAPH